MKFARSLALFAALSLSIVLGGCGTTFGVWAGQQAINGGLALSSSAPAQVQTYAGATKAAEIATRTLDVVVNSANFDRATLEEMNLLNEGLHSSWLALKAANDNNQSLVFGAFNAALTAYKLFIAKHAIKEVTT